MIYPDYLNGVTEGDVFIDYNAIMALGETKDNKEELVPKKKPEKN